MSDEKKSIQQVLEEMAAAQQDFEENVIFLEEPEAFSTTIDVKKLAVYGQPREARFPVGSWVACRPCFEEAQGKTFLGVYLGDMPVGSSIAYHKVKGELMVLNQTNPAMFIPDLNRVVFGYESWWGTIKSPDDLQQISDADIANVWYVKALRDLSAKAEGTPPEAN